MSSRGNGHGVANTVPAKLTASTSRHNDAMSQLRRWRETEAFIEASGYGKVAEVDAALQRGVDPYTENNLGFNCIQLFLRSGRLHAAQWFCTKYPQHKSAWLTHRARHSDPRHGENVLHLVSDAGHLAELKWLMSIPEVRALATTRTECGYNMLDFAMAGVSTRALFKHMPEFSFESNSELLDWMAHQPEWDEWTQLSHAGRDKQLQLICALERDDTPFTWIRPIDGSLRKWYLALRSARSTCRLLALVRARARRDPATHLGVHAVRRIVARLPGPVFGEVSSMLWS